MRKAAMLLTLVLAVIMAKGGHGSAEDSIRIMVNGRRLITEVAPMMENGRVLVPLRAVMEALGREVYWFSDTRIIAMPRGRWYVFLQVGNRYATMGGKVHTLDVAPRVVSNRTMIPLRFISEAAGAQVAWQAETQTVLITYPERMVADVTIKALDAGCKIRLTAVDGADLGKVTRDREDPESIFNPSGAFGGMVGANSIWNPTGTYGNTGGEYSAFNPSSLTPPYVEHTCTTAVLGVISTSKTGTVIVSANHKLPGAVHPDKLYDVIWELGY